MYSYAMNIQFKNWYYTKYKYKFAQTKILDKVRNPWTVQGIPVRLVGMELSLPRPIFKWRIDFTIINRGEITYSLSI